MHRFVRELRQFVAKNYGKRCADYNPFCAACVMWHAFDTIKEGTELGETHNKRKLKKQR